MNPLKAPGPDGLSALFYHKLWHIIGPEICHLVMDILNDNQRPRLINGTHWPGQTEGFQTHWPVYCGHEACVKNISNRIKHILPNIIDED